MCFEASIVFVFNEALLQVSNCVPQGSKTSVGFLIFISIALKEKNTSFKSRFGTYGLKCIKNIIHVFQFKK